MSRFFSEKYKSLVPYTPGEQPKEREFVKLNTNESPFEPSPGVKAAVEGECGRLQLYSDPECVMLRSKLAERYGVKSDQVIVTNGSDEVLNFAFMAFADAARPLAFADITYGFYPVFAQLNGIPYEEIPLNEDFTMYPQDYIGIHKTIVIANPNAPTGLAMGLSDIERILQSNPDHVVIVDEAYVDFGGESAVKLVDRYDNLLVTQTFSKSRSMAGARLGFGIGNEKLIADLNTIRYSTNPYNVNRMTEAAGVAALVESDYYENNCKTIICNRQLTKNALEKLDFYVIPSFTNFLFAKANWISGEALYQELKNRGILIRHFTKDRICEFNRITIGTREQMQVMINAIEDIRKEYQQ